MGSIRYNPSIDGLRAVAVLAVVADHAGLPVLGGFVGVDVFFVISGYLITRLLVPGPIDFTAFYARRARRILPAMALVVVVTLLASLALLPDAHDAAQSAAAAAAFVANVYFQTKTGGYWSASAETMPLLHLWSLSVEEQFYLVWPVVLLLAGKRPVVALWILAGVSFVAAETLLYWSPNAAFYQMPARAWELAAGGLVALGAIRLRGAGIGLLVTLAACFVSIPHFPGVGALPAVIGATWLISALHHGDRIRALESRPVVFVGLISYSLYLWHWPLLALARATHVGETPLGLRLALVVLAFVLAALTWKYVETPFRRAPWRPGRTVAAGVVAAAALSAGALAASPPPAMRHVEVTSLCGAGMKAPGCPMDRRKVVLWGDSFAPPWKSLALSIARHGNMSATWFVAPGCPVTLGLIARKTARETRECHAHNAAVLDYIRMQGADTVVIATNLADLYRANPDVRLDALVAAMHPHVRRIVFVSPTPVLRDDVASCVAADDPCMVTPAEFDVQAGAARKALSALQGVEVVDASDWFLARDRAAYDDREHVAAAAVEQFLSARTRY